MVADNELEGFRRDRYFARSWALLTRDRGWVKPVLLMTVSLLVPIVGLLGVLGYALEWARLTAWNVNGAPKQKGVDVGGCIKSGWRGFVVMLAWAVIAAVVMAIATELPLLGGLVAFVWAFASFLYAACTMVAALRATIYQKLGAGFRVSTLWQMIRHDAGGLVRVAAMMLLGGLLMGLVASAVAMVGLAGVMPRLVVLISYIAEYGYVMSDAMAGALALQFLASLFGALGPALVVIVLVCGFIGVVVMLLGHTAVGLWMRQFDVPSWGRDEDPLPTPVSTPDAGAEPVPAPQELPQPAPAPDSSKKGADAEKNDAPAGDDSVTTGDGPIVEDGR